MNIAAQKIKNIIPMAAVMLLVVSVMASCGSSSLDKTVKKMLLDGDTTETSFAEICKVIKSDSRAYSDYLDDDGEVNVAALNDYINTMGENLRPARHWNVLAYGKQQALRLSIYIERSGSMTAYDTQGGGGELKKAVNDLINFFPASGDGAAYDNVRIAIVNDGVYAYNSPVAEFVKDKNIYASTADIGDARYTDFLQIFNTILSRGASDEVSVLVSDMIYSPRDTRNVSSEKIFNEVNSLATGVFRQYPGKSVIVTKVRGSYHGMYYPYNGAAYRYDGMRPFYVVMIADSGVIDRMCADGSFGRFLEVTGAEATYRFNQPQSDVAVAMLPSWDGSKGRYRVARHGELRLERCEEDRATGLLRFSIAVDLSGLNKDDEFLCDAANYSVTSASNYKIEVQRISPQMVAGNMKSYLEGKTHIITFTASPEVSHDKVVVKILNAFPEWIEASDSRDDSDALAPRFANTTFGFAPFMRGIYDAYAKGGDAYAEFAIEVEK